MIWSYHLGASIGHISVFSTGNTFHTRDETRERIVGSMSYRFFPGQEVYPTSLCQ